MRFFLQTFLDFVLCVKIVQHIFNIFLPMRKPTLVDESFHFVIFCIDQVSTCRGKDLHCILSL